MANVDEHIKNLYVADEYIIKNPSLHEEDSPWKISKIIPLIDILVKGLGRNEITLLDVGGGAGLILKAVSAYIEENYEIRVNEFALDLSPGALEIQMKNNPNLIKTLNEDICETSLADKEIDLTLMIDVLEHIPNPTRTLEELRRISNFVIFKVPLEVNLLSMMYNFLRRGAPRRYAIETTGHINVYSFNKLKYEIEKYTGQVLNCCFTNVFDYYRNSEHYKKSISVKRKITNFVGSYLFKLFPRLCSLIFPDFVMVLVKCY